MSRQGFRPSDGRYMSINNKKLKICPKIIKITAADNGGIMLQWTEVPTADKYAVKRSNRSNGEYELIKWTQKTTYTDKNVKENVTYWYRIVAVKKIEGKRNSKTTSPIAAQVISAIPAPTALKIFSDKKGAIKLKWKAPENVSTFVINRRNDFFEQIIPVGKVEGNKFVDKDVVPGQIYHYSVQSIIEGPAGKKEGNFSKELSCVYLDSGEIVEAKAGLFKNVDLRVRIVAGADGYIIERSEDNENFREVGRTKSGTDIRFRDKADKMFTVYYYRVKAYKNVDGTDFISEGSESVKVKTR